MALLLIVALIRAFQFLKPHDPDTCPDFNGPGYCHKCPDILWDRWAHEEEEREGR